MTTNELPSMEERVRAALECLDDDNDSSSAAQILRAALTATTNEAAAQAEGLTTWQAGVLSKLPPLDVSWPAEVQDGWMRCMSAVRAALATQPVQAQGAVAEVLANGNTFRISRPLPPGTKLYLGPAPAVDRGLSEAQEREAFEAWFLSAGVGKREWLDTHDEYAIDTWKAWQARAALAASAPSQAEPIGNLGPLDPNEGGASRLWAEIVILREMLKGPPGFTSWQDAAVHERMAKNEALRKLKALAPSQAGSCQASETCSNCGGKGYTDAWTLDGEYNPTHCDECPKPAPPAGRTLTDEQIVALFREHVPDTMFQSHITFARAILAASSTTAGERDHG